MLNDLSVLRDIDEIDHITVHYRREGKEFDKEKALLVIKRYIAVYKSAAEVDLGFEATFAKSENLSHAELYKALVSIREALMTQIGLGK